MLFKATLIEAAVIIQYHHIDDNTPAVTSVKPELFSQHMDYLDDQGFNIWPLPRMIEALKNGHSLPDKVVAITFDDGYSSVYTQAWPILRKHGFPFTVFVNTDRVGSSRDFMNWEQLLELSSKGATIANHSADHPHLVRHREGESQQQWHARINEQIVTAEKRIQQKIGYSAGLFAYPYGEYDRRVESIVRELGLIAFAQHSGAFDGQVDWQAVPRFAFGGHYADMAGFIDKVNSLAMPLAETYVIDEQGNRLDDPVLPVSVTRPRLILHLSSAEVAQGLQCFASGQGRIDIHVSGNRVTASLLVDLPVGRSRINCTAASKQAGRFYWYSQFFMRKNEDGSWYQEP